MQMGFVHGGRQWPLAEAHKMEKTKQKRSVCVCVCVCVLGALAMNMGASKYKTPKKMGKIEQKKNT